MVMSTRFARVITSVGGMAAAGASIAALRERRRAKAWKEEYLALLAAAEALRRMAVEVAQEAEAEEIFAAVADGICRVASADVVHLVRDQPDGTRTDLAVWPAEISGVRSTLEVPIVVDDETWGALVVGSTRRKRFPPTAEYRLGGFSEYVGSAISSSQSRVELSRLLSEQQALRRVAMLVASQAERKDVFAAVAEESSRVFDADIGYLCCFQAGEIMRVLAAWSDSGNHAQPGTAIPLKGEGASVQVLRTGRAARVDNYEGMSGPLVDVVRATGAVSSVASPVVVDGRVWGIVSLASREPGRFPPETEACLADFAELVSTAIGNTEARTQLAASRARIVAASDETRRRIERNLHDGTQQRLVTLALQLRGARNAVPPEQGELRDQLEHVEEGLREVLEELREIGRGLHPAVLSQGGLAPALKSLARRSGLPVELDLGVDHRLPEPVEVAAYYVVSEALTNAAKHAGASAASVGLERSNGTLRVSISDDGVGGADPSQGSGLLGLSDRVEALGGHIQVASPPGAGTSIVVEIPVEERAPTG